MFWRKTELEYHILIPPIDKSFECFTEQEAQAYFDWFINAIDHRVEYLKQVSSIDLNYSVKSLTDIWGWFLSHAEIEKAPSIKKSELKKQLKSFPREIRNAILDEQREQFTLQTEYILRDIAMYFGEVYIRNNPSIHWGFHTDINQDSFANMPVLMGFEDRDFSPPFKAYFELNFILRGLACNVFDGDQKKTDLLDMYKIWQRMVFD